MIHNLKIICLLFGSYIDWRYNNNNIQDNVYGAVIMAEPLREFTWFIWWMSRMNSHVKIAGQGDGHFSDGW